jgi:hypothetical protein
VAVAVEMVIQTAQSEQVALVAVATDFINSITLQMSSGLPTEQTA